MNFRLLVDNFWQYTIGGLNAGSIYALVALGYTLVYGVLRLINFAHSEIFMLGTMGSLWATHWLHIGGAARKTVELELIPPCSGRVPPGVRPLARATAAPCQKIQSFRTPVSHF